MSKHSTIEYRCSECGELVKSEGLGPDEAMACEAHPSARIDSCPVEVDIEIVDVEGCDLYLKYDGQTGAQDCHIELDCSKRTLEAESNPEIGNAVPERVWHGHIQRFGIPALRATAANELMHEIAPLAARVCDGYEEHWDGSNNVARFDDDAEAALEEIRSLCEREWGEDDLLHVWDAEDWFGCQSDDLNIKDLGITADTTDEQLAAIDEQMTGEALACPECDGIEGMEQYLERLRTVCQDRAAE